MRQGGRIQAAIEILRRHRDAPPAGRRRAEGLGRVAPLRRLGRPRRDRQHRLRRAPLAPVERVGDGRRHAARLVIGTDRLRRWGIGADGLAALFAGDPHAPSALTEAEAARLAAPDLAAAPGHVRADVPEWLAPRFERLFGERWIAEGEALALRPPLDMRANRLKADRAEGPEGARTFGAIATPFAPDGMRIAATERRRPPSERPGRAGLPEGLVRGPGRGQPARRARDRRRSPASRSSTSAPAPAARRWRCCGDDGEQGPDLRDRQRPDAARADLRSHPPRRRAERPGPRGRRRARRLAGRMDAGARRRALHRHRGLAPAARRQMAADREGARRPRRRAGRAPRTAALSSSRAGGWSMSPVRCCPRRTPTRSPRSPSSRGRFAATPGEAILDAFQMPETAPRLAAASIATAPRHHVHPGVDRNRRVFRRRSQAFGERCSGRGGRRAG